VQSLHGSQLTSLSLCGTGNSTSRHLEAGDSRSPLLGPSLSDATSSPLGNEEGAVGEALRELSSRLVHLRLTVPQSINNCDDVYGLTGDLQQVQDALAQDVVFVKSLTRVVLPRSRTTCAPPVSKGTSTSAVNSDLYLRERGLSR
jgi:hypothetical protein